MLNGNASCDSIQSGGSVRCRTDRAFPIDLVCLDHRHHEHWSAIMQLYKIICLIAAGILCMLSNAVTAQTNGAATGPTVPNSGSTGGSSGSMTAPGTSMSSPGGGSSTGTLGVTQPAMADCDHMMNTPSSPNDPSPTGSSSSPNAKKKQKCQQMKKDAR